MIADRLQELLAGLGIEPRPVEAELGLSSLQVVTLVDQIERVFGLVLSSRDVTRKNFSSAAALEALLAARLAA